MSTLTDSGFYNVVVTDSVGSRLSETGSLIVLVNPVITNNPRDSSSRRVSVQDAMP
jgi:hypothetical protein